MIILDGLELPYELRWIDEWDWTGILQSKKFTLGGRVIINQSQISDDSGRPITLFSENAWITLSDLELLWNKAVELNKRMTLLLHNGSSFSVIFRHDDPPVLVAESIKGIAEPAAADYYKLSVKLLVVPSDTLEVTTTTTTELLTTTTTT